MGTRTGTGRDLEIRVRHLTRVEGHGDIVVDMKEGRLERARLEIVEAPRYFEAMLKGRSFHEAAIITSRICGICSLGHQITSLKATEAALGLEVSEQTVLLRKLCIHGATLQSNILHAYFLAAPDLLGVGSVFPLVASHPDVVRRALRMKRLANDIGDVVSGRAVHPVTPIPGGFTRVPGAGELRELRRRLAEEMMPDLLATIETLKALAGAIPDFTRDTEYISLRCDDEYALYDGDICSTDTGRVPDAEYRRMTNEFVVPHSTSKHCRANRSSYMVGALARWNNNHDKLGELAHTAARALGLAPDCRNPFLNTIAQVVEAAECAEESLRIIDRLLAAGLKDEPADQEPKRFGTGVGATEVPRGILYHEYTYDARGRIAAANCIIPTGQNLANIDADMVALVPQMIGRGQDGVTLALEMLVRAYDPCISCSVHLLDVSFMRIFAVGNSFYGDDGIGAAVLEAIREGDSFPGARLVDLQTDALALVDALAPGETNVVIDAADMGLDPGEAMGFRPSEVELRIRGDHLSLHGFGLADAFGLAAQLGRLPRRVLVVGVQPERVAINEDLSDTVAAAVPAVIDIIRAEVAAHEGEDHPGH